MVETPVVCAICLESTEFARLPCCDSDAALSSSTRFCIDCLGLLCEHAGGTGRCPRCRAWIGVEGGAVVKATAQATCFVCRQQRIIVRNHMCDACHLGMEYPLRYECDRCHGVQRIGHPMWRYQARGPGEFGDTSWACHGCGDYTKWRVVPQDVARVPDGDAPDSWGRRDEWLQRIRNYRAQQLAAAPGNAAAPGEPEAPRRGCAIS